MSFDYNAPAELFLAKPMKGRRTRYQRFATAAAAIRYAIEILRTGFAKSLRTPNATLDTLASPADDAGHH